MSSTTATTTSTHPRRRLRPLLLAAVVATAAAVAAATGLTGATAPASAATSDGWIRVGHLSPNTKGVDVELTRLSGGASVFSLDGVTYGQVSPYKELPAGTYVLSMRASNAPSSKPVISTDVTVTAGKASTVVAYGLNKDLTTTAFSDDLTQPGDGKARVRLVSAATTAKSVDVSTSTGTVVAKNAAFGTATGYATVGAGDWTLDVSGAKAKGTAKVDLKSNTVSTLFVLDDPSGTLTVVPTTDSAAAAATPAGGVQTGGGGTAATEPYTSAVHAFVRLLHGFEH
jgi:hypothetical protein